MPETSVPASGSVMQYATRVRAAITSESQRSRCAAVAWRKSKVEISSTSPHWSATEAYPRESSSMTTAYASVSGPGPPISSGTAIPKSPSSAIRV